MPVDRQKTFPVSMLFMSARGINSAEQKRSIHPYDVADKRFQIDLEFALSADDCQGDRRASLGPKAEAVLKLAVDLQTVCVSVLGLCLLLHRSDY
jgi:hypothetical protein